MISERTEKLQQVAEEQADNLVQYPNTPYSREHAENLKATLEALRASMEIDQMGD